MSPKGASVSPRLITRVLSQTSKHFAKHSHSFLTFLAFPFSLLSQPPPSTSTSKPTQPSMISPNVNSRLCSPAQVAQLTRSVVPLCQASILGQRVGFKATPSHYPSRSGPNRRAFSTTNAAHLKAFFPAKETPMIRETPPAWAHHGWTEKEMLSVVPQHREAKTLGDKFALKLVRTCK